MPRRAIIITGGTANLGFEAARAIARGQYPGSKTDSNEYLIVLASRTDKAHAADAINKEKGTGKSTAVFRRLDLADLDNVRQFARDWAEGAARGDDASYPPIRALLLNAGMMLPRAETVPSTGLEATFAVNHVGHALLFHLLAPYLDQASPTGSAARVIAMSSGTHDPAQKWPMPPPVYTSAEALAHPPPEDMARADGGQQYTNSKLANVLWTYALDRHLREAGKLPKEGSGGSQKVGITANTFNPGLMPGTGLQNGFMWNKVLPHLVPLLRRTLSPNIHSPADAGRNLARLAVGDDSDAGHGSGADAIEGVSGKYIEMRRAIPSSQDSYVEAKQEDLWDWTIKYLAKGDAAEEARFREFR